MRPILAIALLAVFVAVPADAGPAPAAKCVAAKLNAAAKRLAAVTKCRAKAALTATAVDSTCLAKAEEKFQKAFQKAEEKGGCMFTGDAAVIGPGLATCTDTIHETITQVCGNGLVTATEGCDDGGAASGDGCSSTCAEEVGFDCVGEPSVCTSTCGDGVLASDEDCDDADTTNGDGCAATCTVETGYLCAGSPSVCNGICGDGLIRGAETCDDGGIAAGDGCSSTCTLEAGWNCSGEPTTCSCTVTASFLPASGFKTPQILTLDASGSVSGCGLPLQFFWGCSSGISLECPSFLAAANADGNTHSVTFLSIQAFDDFDIPLTVCISGTSNCAPQIIRQYLGVPG